MKELKNRVSRAEGLCLPGRPDLAAAVSVALAVRRRAGGESAEAQTALAASILNCMKLRAHACPAQVNGLAPSGPASSGPAPGGKDRRAAGCPKAQWFDAAEAVARADFADRAFVRALSIVCGLIAGHVEDPTGGATETHAHTEAPRWARAATPKALIGRHFFYAPATRKEPGGKARGEEQGRA